MDTYIRVSSDAEGWTGEAVVAVLKRHHIGLGMNVSDWRDGVLSVNKRNWTEQLHADLEATAGGKIKTREIGPIGYEPL